MVFNHLIFLRPNFVLGTLFYSESSEVGHLPIHLLLKSQIPQFLWTCPNIISSQVQLVLEWWLILSWYSQAPCHQMIFNQNIQVSVLGFFSFFLSFCVWLFCYEWEHFIFQLENELTGKPHMNMHSGNKQTHRNSSNCQKRNTEPGIWKPGSGFRFCHLLAVWILSNCPVFRFLSLYFHSS